ncbi:MAG: hypothetical protein JWQ90_3694 [Hydrocarboniphaga sp.]|uniref:transporter n=1 Tax=Hydrocarboniphaga sp. TaxID=2033016 RepID=UPI0026148AFD|nr:transporter [Hydrocarboniphaga sp.]MDB5971244.1 hypothetical protein [Hydrocarboniphaga sp.]
MPSRLPILSLLLAVPPCWAEVPEFDRPGISFPTSTIPVGGFAIEQGLPDLSYDSGSGLRSTQYGFDTVVRVGAAAHAELQLITALYNRLDQHDTSGSHHADGSGDTGVALKLGLPGNDGRRSMAFLGSLMFPTGDTEFSEGKPTVSLGTSASFALGDQQALSLYANVDHNDGRNTWTLSPDVSFELSDTVGAFVEAGATLARGDDDYVGGGGFTWLVLPNVQLDVYADLGLTAKSTDLQSGFGVSVYFE